MFKAHSRVYHSTLGSRVVKKKDNLAANLAGRVLVRVDVDVHHPREDRVLSKMLVFQALR